VDEAGGGITPRMAAPFALRPALPYDFAFCRRLYFENTAWIILALDLDMARQHLSFKHQWRVAEVRIITVAGQDAGWMQTEPQADVIFLKQIYLARDFQQQGIGSLVIQGVIEEAACGEKAVTLGVAKINPAQRLYQRLGFRVTHEDLHKLYLRREPDGVAM
jgi:GNAT superfamily N-acetyltransferase